MEVKLNFNSPRKIKFSKIKLKNSSLFRKQFDLNQNSIIFISTHIKNTASTEKDLQQNENQHKCQQQKTMIWMHSKMHTWQPETVKMWSDIF